MAKPKGAELDDPSSDDGEEVLTDESVEGESAETSLKVPLKKKRRESVSAEKLPDGKCPRALVIQSEICPTETNSRGDGTESVREDRGGDPANRPHFTVQRLLLTP